MHALYYTVLISRIYSNVKVNKTNGKVVRPYEIIASYKL